MPARTTPLAAARCAPPAPIAFRLAALSAGLLAAFMFAGPPAAAQTRPAAVPAQPPLPDPLDASANVPPVRHSPAFSGYRRLTDAPATPWREANDTVTRIGGWRVYLREAQAPAPAATAAPSPSPAPVHATPATPAATPATPVPAPASPAGPVPHRHQP